MHHYLEQDVMFQHYSIGRKKKLRKFNPNGQEGLKLPEQQ